MKYNVFMELIFGHRQPCAYVAAIDAVIKELKSGEPSEALEALFGLDNNYLIREFDREVYQKVALDAFAPENTADTWGERQTLPFPDLYDVLIGIMEKTGSDDFAVEIAELRRIREEQYQILLDVMRNETEVFRQAVKLLQPHISRKVKKKRTSATNDKLSINSKVKDLMKDPRAVEIIERHAPGASSNPDLKWVMNMKLKSIAPISEGLLTNELLEAIDKDLKQLQEGN